MSFNNNDYLINKFNKAYNKLIKLNPNRETIILFIQRHRNLNRQLMINTVNYSNDELLRIVADSYKLGYEINNVINYMTYHKGIAAQSKDIISEEHKEIIDSVKPQELIKDTQPIYKTVDVTGSNKIYVYNIFDYFINHIEKINRYDVFASTKIYLKEDKFLKTKYFNFSVVDMRETLERLKNLVENYEEVDEIEQDSKKYVSASFIKRIVYKIDFAIFEKKKERRYGEFFMYLSKINLNLSRYQIYNNVDDIDKTPCLIYALKNLGLSEHKITYLNVMFSNLDSFPKSDLNKLCESIDIKIYLNHDDHLIKYNEKSNTTEIYKLCLFCDHYFIDEISEYTHKQFNDLIGVKTDKKIINNKIRSSFLVKKLYHTYENDKDKYLIKVSDVAEIKRQPKENNNINFLDFDKDLMLSSTYKPMEYEEKDDKSTQDIIFLDFETETKKEYHTPYCMVATKIKINGDKYDIIKQKKYIGENSGDIFLNDFVTKNCVLIAHNLKYDFSFLMKYMLTVNTIERNNQLMGGSCVYFNITTKRTCKITLRDSYKMLAYPLRKFNDIFKLGSVKKEIMPYELYNGENINKISVKIDEALQYLPKNEHKEFIKNIDSWNLRTNNDEFKHIDYSLKYCEIDVDVMIKGYMTFRDWLKTITQLDIINYCTISSISHDYMLKSGVYDGCFKFNGAIKKFFQNFIVGGRTMTNRNKKYYIRSVRTQALDGVSLYPSAMSTMGYLKGLPKKLNENVTYDDIKNYDGYFIVINVTKINKCLHFPLLSNKTTDGLRMFENKLGVYYVDKQTLNDLIEFMKIEFNILGGYYFDEGKNETIKNVITNLFNERVKYKKEKNCIQEAFKLIMNSSYGKNILKDIDTENIYIKGENNALYYSLLNNKVVNSMTHIYNSDLFLINRNVTEDTNYTSPHIGCEILSKSKNIMSKVMCLAEDLGIMIFYQDTDSMHIENDKIELLANEYFKKYNSELLGKKLCQFHSDLEFDEELNPNKPKPKQNCEITAVTSIYTGKKSYCDMLEYTDINEKINYCFQYRLKGIPRQTLYNKININYNDDALRLYEGLLFGQNETFDLLDSKPRFKYTKECAYITLSEFTRNISYTCTLDDLEFY